MNCSLQRKITLEKKEFELVFLKTFPIEVYKRYIDDPVIIPEKNNMPQLPVAPEFTKRQTK